MARSTFKHIFYINRSKQKKNGRCPLMGRITIDGEQVQYSLGEDIAPEQPQHTRRYLTTEELQRILAPPSKTSSLSEPDSSSSSVPLQGWRGDRHAKAQTQAHHTLR